MSKNENLTEKAKIAGEIIGYTGMTIIISYVVYKWIGACIGKAIAKELIKAGIVAVL